MEVFLLAGDRGSPGFSSEMTNHSALCIVEIASNFGALDIDLLNH
jgi:hypothetical protein